MLVYFTIIGAAAVRIFARPLKEIMNRRMLHQNTESRLEKHFFYKLGLTAYRFEDKIEDVIEKYESEHSSTARIPIKLIDLEEISREQCIEHGVDVFTDLTMFYGLLVFAFGYFQYRKSKTRKKNRSHLALTENDQRLLNEITKTIETSVMDLEETDNKDGRDIDQLEAKLKNLEQRTKAKVNKYIKT